VTSPGGTDPSTLADGVRSGNRRAVARAITLVESTRPDHRADALMLLDALLADTGQSIRIGISGPPGVGKSTFIESFGLHLVEHGHQLAVLAVDPTSTRSGGSVLGDKTRMAELSRHPSAFIRPSPGGAEVGGVARRTREAIAVCEASGRDVVFVETIGVGQSEVAVADMVDCFVLLVAPAGGDELQGIKRGVMELADLLVVTKADGDTAPAAARAVADHRHALQLIRPRYSSWRPEVIACSAVEGSGIDDAWAAITRFADALDASGELDVLRREQSVAWLWSELHHLVEDRVRRRAAVAEKASRLEASVRTGDLAAPAAAAALLEALDAVDSTPSVR
jgi:LAO/AO transport system kinase